MNKLLAKSIVYITNFVKAQLIITAASIPILINWGIPISIMSIVGNFIFTPILTLFLIISSLLFFTELFSIPNAFLVSSLTATTNLWEWMLSFGKKTWLIGFAQPHPIISWLILLVVILLLLKFIFKIIAKFFMMAVIILTIVTLTNHYRHNKTIKFNKTEIIPHCAQKLFVTHLENGTIQLTDNGYFNRKQSPENFISFELKPYLIKKHGTLNIENITLNKPGIGSFKAAQELCDTFTVQKVKLALFDTKLSKYGWKCFFDLKQATQKNNTKLIRFKKT